MLKSFLAVTPPQWSDLLWV